MSGEGEEEGEGRGINISIINSLPVLQYPFPISIPNRIWNVFLLEKEKGKSCVYIFFNMYKLVKRTTINNGEGGFLKNVI